MTERKLPVDGYGQLLVTDKPALIQHKDKPLIERLHVDQQQINEEKRMRAQVFRGKPNVQKRKTGECVQWTQDIQDALDYIKQLERMVGEQVEQGQLAL